MSIRLQDSAPWSQSDLTGNSMFVVDSLGVLWVVSNTTDAGVATIFKSSDYGMTFTEVISFTVGSKEFDPAVDIDPDGILHIVGTRQTDGKFDIVKYRLDTRAEILALMDPVVISTSNRVSSDYDVVAMPAGHSYVVGSIVEADGYAGMNAILGMELDEADGQVGQISVIAQSPIRSGQTYGSLTLALGSTAIELYVGTHDKVYTGRDQTLQFTLYTRVGGAWGEGVQLYKTNARHVDDRLTVVAYGDKRFVSQNFYTQDRKGLTGNALLGYYDGTDWSWKEVLGTPEASITEPIFLVNPEGQLLLYIERNLSQPFADGRIRAKAVSLVGTAAALTWKLDDYSKFRNQAQAAWLRGTKQPIPDDMVWGFIGETSEGISAFYTGYNVPPIVSLTPSTLVATRNTDFTLDASASYDPNLDDISFEWLLEGLSEAQLANVTLMAFPTGIAILHVANQIGPEAVEFTVRLRVTDLDEQGAPLGHPVQEATCAVSVPYNAQPTVTWEQETITATRNTELILTPTIEDADAEDVLTYQWSQISGTPVEIVGAADGPTLTIRTNGVNDHGETLVFRLTVSDQVNDAVTSDVSVEVVSYPMVGLDSNVLNRAIWLQDDTTPATIAQRNLVQQWSQLFPSALYTNLRAVKRSVSLQGSPRYLLISDTSVLVFQTTEPPLLLRKLLPVQGVKVVDAVHTENDYTIMLGSGDRLYRYGEAPLINTDNPDAEVDISDLTQMTGFTRIYTTYSHGDIRVVALASPNGCLLMQFKSSTFTPQGVLALTMQDSLLYGSNNVQWIRMNNVESLRTGRILVGTVSASGNTYETLVDLQQRKVLGTWDASKLRNKIVSTGEILFSPESGYVGKPQAPVLDPVALDSKSGGYTTIFMSWSQARPDLVQGYDVEMNSGAGYALATRITSGVDMQTKLQLGPGTYSFRVRAVSQDGVSDYSNVRSITLA